MQSFSSTVRRLADIDCLCYGRTRVLTNARTAVFNSGPNPFGEAAETRTDMTKISVSLVPPLVK